MEKKETIVVEAAEKINMMGTCEVNSRDLPTWEMDVPGGVINHLEIYVGDRINFIEENGRIYIEKAQDCLKTMTEEKTIVSDKEKKTASKEDYYTRHERSMKEDFDPLVYIQ